MLPELISRKTNTDNRREFSVSTITCFSKYKEISHVIFIHNKCLHKSFLDYSEYFRKNTALYSYSKYLHRCRRDIAKISHTKWRWQTRWASHGARNFPSWIILNVPPCIPFLERNWMRFRNLEMVVKSQPLAICIQKASWVASITRFSSLCWFISLS